MATHLNYCFRVHDSNCTKHNAAARNITGLCALNFLVIFIRLWFSWPFFCLGLFWTAVVDPEQLKMIKDIVNIPIVYLKKWYAVRLVRCMRPQVCGFPTDCNISFQFLRHIWPWWIQQCWQKCSSKKFRLEWKTVHSPSVIY